MKKRTGFILSVILALCLCAGCAEGDSDTGGSGRVNLSDLNASDYVTLGDYYNIEVSVEKEEISDEEAEDEAWNIYLDLIDASNGGIMDRTVKDGDTVNIDYVGYQDDVAFDGGTASGQNLTIGSGTYIDGFEEGLIGVMPGESVDLYLSFPDDYFNEDMAGAEVVFAVTLNYIEPDEMEDGVVAAFGSENYGSVDELVEYARSVLEDDILYYYEEDVENAVLNAVIASCTFSEMPEELVSQYGQMAADSYDALAAYMGVDLDSLLGYYFGMDTDSFISFYGELYAEEFMMMQAIAETEGLLVSDDELSEEIEMYALYYGFESGEEYLEYFDYNREELREQIMYNNVLEYLVENAIVTN